MGVFAITVSCVSINSFKSTGNTSYIISENNIDTLIDKTYIEEDDGMLKTPYKVSKQGENFIKGHEKLRLNKYLIKGEKYYTVGWGHQVREKNIPYSIDIEYAQRLFDDDMNKVNASINRLIKELPDNFDVTQCFIDGLGSLVFNCGESGIRNSEFFMRLKRCRFDENGNINMNDWVYTIETLKYTKVFMNGHKTRRMNEYNLIKHGRYDTI